MATWKFDGVDDYVASLEKLENSTREMIGEAVYEGAKVVADAVKEAIISLPTDNRKFVKDGRKGISDQQKQGLIDGFGIASMRNDNGFFNVKLGFEGYNSVRTKKFPKGQPNLMIARVTESGSSFMPKFRYISQATNNAKKQCEEAMRKTFEKNVENEMK